MLRRIMGFAVALPAGLLLVTLAVSNSHDGPLVLDPFRPEHPVLAIVLPFYVYLFGVLLLGIVIGGAAVWRTQAPWRRAARRGAGDAQRWRAEAERLQRERAGIEQSRLAARG